MATINTADDLIEVLRNDDRMRSAVRRELLTEEVLALPERVDKMVEAQSAMQETQTEILETQTEMLKNIESLTEGQIAAAEHRTKLHALHREEHDALHRFRATTMWTLQVETGSRSQRCSRNCALWNG